MRLLRSALRFGSFLLLCTPNAFAQSGVPERDPKDAASSATQPIDLRVPAGTPLRVALDGRVRIERVGEPVRAKLTQPVYAFDQEVIPAGGEVLGKVTRIDPVPGKKRALGIANGDFSPPHTYELVFESLELADGRTLPISTQVSPGSAEVVHLVADPERAKKRNAAAKAAADAKQQASDTVHAAIHDIKTPGRMERFKHYLASQLPYRHQYLEPGTRFNAVLEAPLDFGTTTRSPEQLSALGTPPGPESLVQARLASEVSSATAQQGTLVEAILTAPLFSPENKLVLPANSRLIGEVVQAKPAGKLHHNGTLRVAFQRIELPEGTSQPVHADLEGMEVDRAAQLKMDTEGGAQATDSKTRYLRTALSIAIAAAATRPDVEHGTVDSAGDPGMRTAAGGSSMRLVGIVISLAARSQVFSAALGAYGAASSVYTHFISRGRDVVLAKDTPLEIGFGRPHPSAANSNP